MKPAGVLLDTCAVLFIAEEVKLRPEAHTAIQLAASEGKLYVSPVSALEIGRLVALGKIALKADTLNFFLAFLNLTAATLCQMGPDILVGSSFLPGTLHRDPMDRILIATARQQDIAVATRDRAILAYAEQGHVRAIAC